MIRVQRRAAPAARLRQARPARHRAAGPRRRARRRAVGALRARPGARLRLQHRRRLPLPRATSTRSAARAARSFRAIPHKIKPLDELGMPAVGRPASPTCPAAWCWSPARPARARRPRWPRCSTWPTAPAPRTSSPSRTRSSSCTRTSAAWSTSARSASTPPTSPTALKHALRQDPDIILVGELRDLETTSTALTAAETGHLVLATLHTQCAAQTIDRRHRHLPAAPAAADPRPAGRLRCRAWSPRRWRRARTARAGRSICEIMFATAGDPQPDPRGQDPPDPVVHAVRGDDGMLTLRPAPGRAGHASS